MDKRLIHIYTGEGKGKTTAALGLCMRAVGSGLRVLIVRFLKRNDSSELEALKLLPNLTLIPNEKEFGFSPAWKNSPEKKAVVREYYSQKLQETIDEAVRGEYDLLMMDEIMAAVRLEVIDKDVLLEFLKTKPDRLEVVMTGRDPLPELAEIADYISEIRKIKHPFDEGIRARKGIEY